MLDIFRRTPVFVLCAVSLLTFGCSSTSSVDGVWDDTLEAKEQTFGAGDPQAALKAGGQKVVAGLLGFEQRVEEFPDTVNQRLAFDKEKAITVDEDGIKVTRDTFNYVIRDWLPQVTGSDKRAEEEAARAAKAEEELRNQVASTRNASNAPAVSPQQNYAPGAPQPFDLSGATPMASTQNFLASSTRGGGSQLAAAPSYVNNTASAVRSSTTATNLRPTAQTSTYTAPQVFSGPSTSKSISGGLEGVGRFFDQNGYTLESIRRGTLVPPVFTRRLPKDMNNSTPMNKDVFLRLMVPLALKVNAEIAAERRIITNSGYNGPIPNAPSDVRQIAAKYDIQSNTSNLLQRVDVLPVSLILAQSGLESGWGTSRYVQQGNALFGQRVWDASQPGMTPSDREGDQSHRVRTFNSLEESIRSYAKNLNTHRAYLELRKTRASYRQSGRPISARDLIPALNAYSEDPAYYSGTLNTILSDSRLTDFDKSRLSNGQPMNLYL